MHDTDGILDVDQYCDPGSGLLIEFTDFGNVLQDVSTQMLFDKQ